MCRAARAIARRTAGGVARAPSSISRLVTSTGPFTPSKTPRVLHQRPLAPTTHASHDPGDLALDVVVDGVCTFHQPLRRALVRRIDDSSSCLPFDTVYRTILLSGYSTIP